MSKTTVSVALPPRRIDLWSIGIWVGMGLFLLAAMLLCGDYALASTSSLTVSPTAPLTGLETARSAAQSSNLNISNMQTTGNSWLSLIEIVFAVVGVSMAGFSAAKLYKNVQGGDSSRDSNFIYIMGFGIGSLMTIIAVLVGVVTTWVTN
ncbi:hypothetical protein JK182_01905 [Acetobacter okinawensis]|uniref:hypothetical protein n=1 Tax=Acetobacter okinawensis TaxID=1076594 RepID=UPI001BA66B0D|nr:hypothetical protein [Acetobacter okinawensis]MBS0987448.1 hypothetical protein [Acetobacter okinawensis]